MTEHVAVVAVLVPQAPVVALVKTSAVVAVKLVVVVVLVGTVFPHCQEICEWILYLKL